MNTPQEISAQIERLKQQIKELLQQIKELLQQIKELLWSPVCNNEGEIVSYQDYQDSLDN